MNFLDPATISSLLCGLIAMLDSLRALAGFTSKVTCVFDIIFSSYSSSNFRVIPLYLICTAITIQKNLMVGWLDRKSTRLNSSHTVISYAVFCLKKKKK